MASVVELGKLRNLHLVISAPDYQKKSASSDKISKPAFDSSYQLQSRYQLNVNSLFTQCVVHLNTRINSQAGSHIKTSFGNIFVVVA